MCAERSREQLGSVTTSNNSCWADVGRCAVMATFRVPPPSLPSPLNRAVVGPEQGPCACDTIKTRVEGGTTRLPKNYCVSMLRAKLHVRMPTKFTHANHIEDTPAAKRLV